jgi:AcrR family transcriptional regulator
MILDTAARLFRREGYSATSLRSIASACDMKAGSLYYHFESKDRIVSEVLDIGVQRVFDAVRLAVEKLAPDAALGVILHGAIEAHLSALLHAHDFTSANIRILGQVPASVRDSHRALRRAYENYWRELLLQRQRNGQIRTEADLQQTVYFLFGAMNWATEWYDEKRFDLKQVASQLAELVVLGLQAPPELKAELRPKQRSRQKGKHVPSIKN